VSLGVPENKEIGTLTERQRQALASGLAGEPPRERLASRRVLSAA
jgi:hypothetical protein